MSPVPGDTLLSPQGGVQGMDEPLRQPICRAEQRTETTAKSRGELPAASTVQGLWEGPGCDPRP